MRMKLFILYLKAYLKEKYPDVDFSFYLSKRKEVYMDLLIPLLSYADCQKVISNIKEMWLSKKNVDFYFVKPRLIHMMKWKCDYLISEKNC